MVGDVALAAIQPCKQFITAPSYLLIGAAANLMILGHFSDVWEFLAFNIINNNHILRLQKDILEKRSIGIFEDKLCQAGWKKF